MKYPTTGNMQDPHEAAKGPSITCPDCGMTSYHPNDIAAGYCGNCHAYTSAPTGEEGSFLKMMRELGRPR